MACLERALDEGDTRTALALLKGVGLRSGDVKIGSDDPEQLRRHEEQSEQVQTYTDMLIDMSYPKLPPGSN